jgi:hypothetical protein
MIQSYLGKRDAKKSSWAIPFRAISLLTIMFCMEKEVKGQNKVSRLDQTPA